MKTDVFPELVELPPGRFLMGETPGDKFATDTERPAHSVRLDYVVALGRFPVTCAEYQAFDAAREAREDADLPMVNVSWNEASSYCFWLAEQTGLPYRLPSEAEWEYACRAGSATPFGAGSELPVNCANYLYDESGERIGPGARTPSGSYPENAYGLRDLHGNVCEWVEDAWHAGYAGAPIDGSAWGEPGADLRVIRGGAWDYLPRLLRSAWRDALSRHARRDNVGFRIALTVSSLPCAS